MRKITILLVLAFMTFHCKKDDRIIFDFQYQQNLNLPAGLTYLQTHFFEFYDIQTNFQSLLKAKGLTAKDIKKISPGSGFMLALDSGINMDFIQEVSIMISSTNQYNKEVFYTIQVPYDVGGRIDLAGTLVDAYDVLSQDRFNMRIGFKLRSNCPTTFLSRFTLKFLAI